MAFYKYVFLLFVVTSITLADRVNKKGKTIKIEPAPKNFTFDALRVEPTGEVRVSPFNPAMRNWNAEPVRMARPNFRIVGGRKTNTKEVPYQAFVGLYNFGQDCGATIYNKEWIITASHCVFDGTKLFKKSRLFVSAGVFDLTRKEKTEQTRNISQIIAHDSYLPIPGLFNDIALIKLDKPLVYTEVVQPLPIGPASEEYPPIGEAVISGWGYTEARERGSRLKNELFSTVLKSTTIEVFTKEECIKIYSDAHHLKTALSVYPTTMCAGLVEGGRDACQGDSGGPLQCLDSAGKKYLCGVIATGIGCGLPNLPGFYTIVSKYAQDFIKKHAGEGDQPTIPY